MATSKDRENFLLNLARNPEFAHITAYRLTDIGRLLLRHSKSHGNIMEAQCNGHPACSSPTLSNETISKLQARHEAWCEKREAQLERRMTELAVKLGCGIEFSGDPRGWTVRLILKDGGREVGVPQ